MPLSMREVTPQRSPARAFAPSLWSACLAATLAVALVGERLSADAIVSADPPSSAPAKAPASTPSSTPAPSQVPAPPKPALPTRVIATGEPRITLRGFTKTREAASPNDDQDLMTLGRLVFAKVDVECDDATVGASIRALADALGVNIAMKFDVEFVDDTPVFLSLKDVDGVAALEAIIAQGAGQGGNAGTWQLRRGILEVGSRTFLARMSARRTQLYDVSTLVFDVPYNPSGGISPSPVGHLQPQLTMGPDPESYRRKSPTELAADLMQAITTQVEPEAWQPLPEGDGSDGTAGPKPRLPQGGHRNRSAVADRNFDASLGPPFVRGKWASLEYYRQGAHLMVSAPDFVHRGINGYPPALPVAPKSR